MVWRSVPGRRHIHSAIQLATSHWDALSTSPRDHAPSAVTMATAATNTRFRAPTPRSPTDGRLGSLGMPLLVRMRASRASSWRRREPPHEVVPWRRSRCVRIATRAVRELNLIFSTHAPGLLGQPDDSSRPATGRARRSRATRNTRMVQAGRLRRKAGAAPTIWTRCHGFAG